MLRPNPTSRFLIFQISQFIHSVNVGLRHDIINSPYSSNLFSCLTQPTIPLYFFPPRTLRLLRFYTPEMVRYDTILSILRIIPFFYKITKQ